MSGRDYRGCSISGATPVALEAYERALAAYQSWRIGTVEPLGAALQHAPRFVMAHVLRAWQLVCSRDPRSVALARPLLAEAAGLSANEGERLHLAAIAATLSDDYDRAKTHLGDALLLQPRDALALQAAHSLDYLTGDLARMRDRVKSVLPAWSAEMPGYHAVLAMHAFSLEECGEYDHAEQAARAALALNAGDARAHHAMAHVFEMTERAEAGIRWMDDHFSGWGIDSVVATHCWWHLALFHLSLGNVDRALAVYDQRLRSNPPRELSDLIDSSALLWRVDIHDGDTRGRWSELASAWTPHIDDRFCSFSDVHAMLAFVGARDWAHADRLERLLSGVQSFSTRHGSTTRLLGLPACRALIAFGRGKDNIAISLLAKLPTLAHRLGGSLAQRDVLHLTLQRAIERVGRPLRRMRNAFPRLAAST